MKIALDATYSLGESLSGVGVYSRELLHGLADIEPETSWEWFYRSQRYWRARGSPRPPNVRRRFLADSFGSRSAQIFHGLNQRLPRKRFRRQVSTFHDLFVLSGNYSTEEFRIRFAAQAREAAASSDLIVTVSRFTALQVEEYLGISPERLRVIPHGVVPRAIPTVARENIVLCVGAIQRRKNQAAVVKAFRALPGDWRLVLAGSQGFESEETMDQIRKSPCSSRITVTGYLTDTELAHWYGRAAIFAFPSLDEGFGMPILEAMAAQVPVITSNCSAMPEVAGDAAMLVDPASEAEIADALLRLAHDGELREKLTALGKIRAAQFTWAKAVRSTAAIYRELV